MEITQRGEKSLNDLKRAFVAEPSAKDDPRPKEPVGGWSDGLGVHVSNPSEPRTTGWPVTANGQQYLVSSCEARIKGQFENKIRAEALQAIQEVRKVLGEEAAEKALHKFVAERSLGHYNLDGKYCLQALMEWPGTTHFFFLLLRRCHPKITEDEAKRLFVAEKGQCITAVKWALGNWIGSTTDGMASGTESPSVEKGVLTTKELAEEEAEATEKETIVKTPIFD